MITKKRNRDISISIFIIFKKQKIRYINEKKEEKFNFDML